MKTELMKLPLTLFLLFLLFFPAIAQKKFTLGLMGGPNFSLLQEIAPRDGQPFVSSFNGQTRWLAGLQAGLAATYRFSNRFALSANALYAQKGYRMDNPILTFRETGTTNRFEYLSFPFLSRFYPVEEFYLEAGAEVSTLLSAGSRTIEENIGLGRLITIKDIDWGLALGFGFTVVKRLHLQARYIHGLSSLLEAPQLISQHGMPLDINPGIYKNRSLQFSVVMGLVE